MRYMIRGGEIGKTEILRGNRETEMRDEGNRMDDEVCVCILNEMYIFSLFRGVWRSLRSRMNVTG